MLFISILIYSLSDMYCSFTLSGIYISRSLIRVLTEFHIVKMRDLPFQEVQQQLVSTRFHVAEALGLTS